MAEIKRFNPYHRILHSVMAISFLGLVASGMPLKYSHAPWAAWLMKLLGGYHAAGTVHRVCGAITFGYFAAHILFVLYDIAVIRKFKFNPLGPESMVPWIKDLQDIIANFKWFLGLGPRPLFDRFTYWEKFDYWAVFWGVGMIGLSGLLLWFPAFFGRFIPGWGFNIATIIHSDEALLAAGFIFTIHFFNTHLRPEKFPMDYVIFSGTLSVDELKHERPLEYRRLVEEKRLPGLAVPGQKPWLTDLGILFGFALVIVGLVLLVLIILGQFYY
jgi:cytochrome b subunit of formate dehydrogenase